MSNSYIRPHNQKELERGNKTELKTDLESKTAQIAMVDVLCK